MVSLDFQSLLEGLPHLLWASGPDGNLDYVSPQWLSFTGAPEEDLLGHGWLASLHPGDQAGTMEAWAKGLRGGENFEIDNRIRRVDGCYRWFKMRAAPKRNELGQICRWQGSQTEMTAELEAREKAELTSSLIDVQRVAKLGTWTMFGDSERLKWSTELYTMFGANPDLPPPSLEDQAHLFLPESWERLTRALELAITEGRPYELELAFRDSDGQLRWLLARGERWRDETGWGLRGTAQDITTLMTAQESLSLQSARMRVATEAAHMGVWELDSDSGRLTWDPIMHELYGTDSHTFGGVHECWRQSIHPDDVAEVDRRLAQSLALGCDFDAAFRIITPCGEQKYLRGKGRVRTGAGSGKSVVGVNWDVTEQHNMELRLQSRERLLQEFVKHVPAAIAMFDKEMRYLQHSQRWLTDYDLSEDLTGRSHYDVFPDIPERWKVVHQKVLRGAVERCDEDPFVRQDGTVEWLSWEVRPWRQDDGQVGGVIMFTHVITARKNLEVLLQQQTAELMRSNHDLEQFAYAASHDLQEPLRAVSGCTQILKSRYEDQLDARAQELIRHIVEGAHRMQTLMLDLLAYSRVDRQGGTIERTSSSGPLREALVNLRQAIEESDARLVVPDKLPEVMADGSQLVMLWQNLIGNAIKYRSERPLEIVMTVVQEGSFWRFSLADNGIGIHARHFERIFLLFQRLHTREEYAGTGIGLALCKRIVERHGGRIWVESEPGRGTIFHFTLEGPE